MSLKDLAATAVHYLTLAVDVADKLTPLLPIGEEAKTAIGLASRVAAGVVAAEPAMVTLYEEITAAAAGSAPPTAEQWAEWNARADQAHADLQATLKA